MNKYLIKVTTPLGKGVFVDTQEFDGELSDALIRAVKYEREIIEARKDDKNALLELVSTELFAKIGNVS